MPLSLQTSFLIISNDISVVFQITDGVFCLFLYSVASFFWKASHYCSIDLSLIPEPSGVMSTAALLTLVRSGGNQVRRRVLLRARGLQDDRWVTPTCHSSTSEP